MNRSHTVVCTNADSGDVCSVWHCQANVSNRPGFEREVEPVSAAVLVIVHAPPRAVEADAILQETLAVGARLEGQRLDEAVAKAHVHNPRAVERHDQHQMIADCRLAPCRPMHCA